MNIVIETVTKGPWELVEEGRAGLVTLLGMGGVFIALICLYLFTSVLGRLNTRRRSRRQEGKTRPGNGAASTSSPPGDPEAPFGDEELAAAVAVAYALETQAIRPGPAAALARGGGGEDPWKMAGRLALMKPWSRASRF